MAKIKQHIIIVRTDVSRQSSMGLKSCLMLRDVLARHYSRVEIATVRGSDGLQQVADARPDLAFLGLKRTGQHDNIWASAFLGARGINYTGSGQAAIELDMHKNLAKQVVLDAGLPTARHFMARPGEYRTASALPLEFPLFIKPPTQGGGKGIASDSVVRDFESYSNKVRQIYTQFGTPALIESYLDGREFSVALLGSGEELLAMPVELIAGSDQNGDRILSASVKQADAEQVVAVVDRGLRTHLQRLATDIYVTLGGRDYGRIDIRMDHNNKLYFLEANLIPGVAHHDFISYFTHACIINEQLSHEAMVLKIVEICLRRSEPKTLHNLPSRYVPAPLNLGS